MRRISSLPFSRLTTIDGSGTPWSGRTSLAYPEVVAHKLRILDELLERGLSSEDIDKLQPILALSGTNEEKLSSLRSLLAGSEIGMKGVEELTTLLRLADGAVLPIELDLTLARGLNYYTGAIFEVKALDVQIGSITGGGRYDNLTGVFGLSGISGVGISFGADRIYDVLTELNLFPDAIDATQVMFAAFGNNELAYALSWAKQLREKGLAVEVYPEPAKMKKQLGYANANAIPFVAVVGETEMNSNTVMLKNMLSGEQQQVTIDTLCQILTNNLTK